MPTYEVERLDHLGIVAGVCQEIGLVEYFDALDQQGHACVSRGQAVQAMILNGLGFSNRRLYLVPQFFTYKPVERLIGPGITADDLNDDCLGRTLDWLTAHDLTALFAGLAYQARRRFGVSAEAVHVDTSSFAVEGAYVQAEAEEAEDATLIRLTYGYSRDHRADLKQWPLSLATTGTGVPIGWQLLAGNASDKQTLRQQVEEGLFPFRMDREEEPIYCADSGLYSEGNMSVLSGKHVRWVSRVPETSSQAQTIVAREPLSWQGTEAIKWHAVAAQVNERTERWIVVQRAAGLTQHLATLQQRAAKDLVAWTKRVQGVAQQIFACTADAESALATLQQQVPPCLHVEPQAHYAERGRPRKDASPTATTWTIQGTVRVDTVAVHAEAWRKATFILATNVPTTDKSAEEIIRLYKEQTSVGRGFGFLKDPLFLASSVFVKKTERVMATGFLMVLCLLVFRLAEQRIRQRLAETGETVSDQRQNLVLTLTARAKVPNLAAFRRTLAGRPHLAVALLLTI